MSMCNVKQPVCKCRLQHIMRHLHLQPQEAHGVDFSRVRMWTLNGWARFYRQTLVFSAVPVPEVSALFNKHCHSILHFHGNRTSLLKE